MSEINVTPFVDVMLVLLVIFMISAPLLTSAIPVELPRSSAENAPQEDNPLTLSVNAQGDVFLEDEKLDLVTLRNRLATLATEGVERPVYLRGDESASYGTVGEVLGLLAEAGFTKVTLPTRSEP